MNGTRSDIMTVNSTTTGSGGGAICRMYCVIDGVYAVDVW